MGNDIEKEKSILRSFKGYPRKEKKDIYVYICVNVCVHAPLCVSNEYIYYFVIKIIMIFSFKNCLYLKLYFYTSSNSVI